MSDIPGARRILQGLLTDCVLGPHVRDCIREVISKMTREPAIRRARSQMTPITDTQKLAMKVLSRNTHLTCADIAIRVGLPSSASGRVSEVLNGLR